MLSIATVTLQVAAMLLLLLRFELRARLPRPVAV